MDNYFPSAKKKTKVGLRYEDFQNNNGAPGAGGATNNAYEGRPQPQGTYPSSNNNYQYNSKDHRDKMMEQKRNESRAIGALPNCSSATLP